MMRKLLVALSLCSAMPVMAEDITSEYAMPNILKDCKVLSVESNGSKFLTNPIKTIVCDNAKTTTTNYSKGKTRESISKIDIPPRIDGLHNASSTREKCEEFLPRNKNCVAVTIWVPEN